MRKLFNFVIALLFISCQPKEEIKGPFFGNGIKNGWADQNSIVIWTRLTKNKEAFFNVINWEEVNKRYQAAL